MIKTLIVEDDPMVREINEKFLEKISGYTHLESVQSVESAKESIKKEIPDLILLDIFLLNGRGIDLLRWVRKENYNTDVILITADKNADTFAEANRLGAIDYLIKPFTFERFEKALDKYKCMKTKLSTIEEVEQDLIDEMKAKNEKTLTDNECVSKMKGFSQPTYEKIVAQVKKMKGQHFTSMEIADITGVSRITARRYLDYLESEGILEMELEYGKVGRPKNKYIVK